MTLEELKTEVRAIEPTLASVAYAEVRTFRRDGRALRLCLTERLRRRSRRGRVWLSKPFLTALKNAAYGFDSSTPRSRGGSDGIFLLDRTFSPPNSMMKKLFAGYIDKPNSGFTEVAAALPADPADLIPVRLVSHHLRLLGVLHRSPEADCLILVDYDVG